VSSSLRSAPQTDGRDELLRRFVEAARRAQLVTIVNRAETEAELGALVTEELCEAFEAEVAFIVVRPGDGFASVVGAYGLQPAEEAALVVGGLLDQPFDVPRRYAGDDLNGIGARALVCAPFDADGAQGVVAVARLHDQGFDEAESALLETVAATVAHALERLRLAAERDRLYRDANERAQAARVIGSIADGVLLVDGAETVQLWNSAAEAITGLPHDLVLGRRLEEALPGWSEVRDLLHVDRDRGSSNGRATSVPLDVGGNELWLSISGVAVDDGTVYAFRDLTEERRLEQLKADFIATVSHELRTPLAAVHGAAKTLQRDDIVLGGAVSGQLLRLICEQSERLATMVNDILLASRVDSPELPVATEDVDAAEVASEVIAAARAHANERLTLGLVAPPSLPAVAADRDKLRQVLTNLVANAIKYSPAGGRVEVEITSGDRDATILVRDEGLGIASAEQDLIFRKFYRTDANMTRGVSGSGLGLYISRELVQRMGGTISVDSRLGEGSTFVVTLRLATGPPEAA
jgi:two-component system phosphate regulon sensor histidine kinase PhoR